MSMKKVLWPRGLNSEGETSDLVDTQYIISFKGKQNIYDLKKKKRHHPWKDNIIFLNFSIML